MPSKNTKKKQTDIYIEHLTKGFEESDTAKLLEEQLNNTSCRKVKIHWTITKSDDTRYDNNPRTESTIHDVKGYVLGTVKNNNRLLPIYTENETVKVLIKRDITDIKDIDASSEIPNVLLLHKIQEWNGSGKHNLQIEPAESIKIIETPIEKKFFVKLDSGEYSLLKYGEDGYHRGKTKYKTPEHGSTVIEYTDYENNYRGKKKGGNRKTIKSTKKQTKKSKSYKRRTIKKH